MRFLDLPPLWLIVFAFLAWVQVQLVPVPDIGLVGDGLGLVLVLAGIGLMLAAAAQFPRHKTSIVPHRQPDALIASGVYRFSRNPIYLADVLILTGLCLIWSAILGVALVPGFMQVIKRRFILPEEARLRDAFGRDFEAWAVHTRRWI